MLITYTFNYSWYVNEIALALTILGLVLGILVDPLLGAIVGF